MTDALTTTPARYLKAAADGHLGRVIGGSELTGFRQFFEQNPALPKAKAGTETARQRRLGYSRARAVCYAQGALAAAHYTMDHSTPRDSNPYPQFSPAWEAWAEGYDDHAAGALG